VSTMVRLFDRLRRQCSRIAFQDSVDGKAAGR
jgi:hypothetical protein